jgi:hypothetical protein
MSVHKATYLSLGYTAVKREQVKSITKLFLHCLWNLLKIHSEDYYDVHEFIGRSKALPLHAMEALGWRGEISPTHY